MKKEELFRHYALSVPFYTHFTSPIRRYPDVMVHRLLQSALQKESMNHWNPKGVAKYSFSFSFNYHYHDLLSLITTSNSQEQICSISNYSLILQLLSQLLQLQQLVLRS